MSPAALPLADVLESDWDRDLFRGPDSLAVRLGWVSYHTLRSKGSKSGYPDRTVVRERILFVELKREKTRPTDEQIAWLDRLARAGGECYLWRPSDLGEIGRVLSKRWTYCNVVHVDGPGGRLHHEHVTWTPASLWIPGVGRADQVETPKDEQQLFTKARSAF